MRNVEREYLEKMLIEYAMATGNISDKIITAEDPKFKQFIQDQLYILNDDYKKFLIEYGAYDESLSICEVGKGKYDSIIGVDYKDDFTERISVSPYASTKDSNLQNSILISENGQPFRSNIRDKKATYIGSEVILSYNPYGCGYDSNILELLKVNFGEDEGRIGSIGVFGLNEDFNKDTKLNFIDNLSKLTGDNVPVYVKQTGTTYMSFLALSEPKVRIRNPRKR